MKIFVTGGSGFLGSHLVDSLVEKGHHVTALARSRASAEKLRSMGAQIVEGSLSDIGTWETNLHGHDVVIHCASPVVFWGAWQKFEHEIVYATRELLAASDRQKVRRFIHVSSESVLQDKEPLLNINESFPYPAEPNSAYGKAKMLAEQAILQTRTSVERIILRPTFIWSKDSQAIQGIVARYKAGQFIWLDQGAAPFEAVHVLNVVHAITLAMEKGNDGKIYAVTDDERSTVREFFEPIFRNQKGHPRVLSVRSSWLRTFVNAMECTWKALGVRHAPPLTRFELSFLSMPRQYDISKAKRDLGYKPVVKRWDMMQ